MINTLIDGYFYRKSDELIARFVSPVPNYKNHINMNQSQVNSERVSSTLRNQLQQREELLKEFSNDNTNFVIKQKNGHKHVKAINNEEILSSGIKHIPNGDYNTAGAMSSIMSNLNRKVDLTPSRHISKDNRGSPSLIDEFENENNIKSRHGSIVSRDRSPGVSTL